MRSIVWSNGHVDKARTWQDMLDHVRKSQWWFYNEQEFRAEMAKRAKRWSGTDIDMGANPRRFFMELQRARMIVVLRDGEEF